MSGELPEGVNLDEIEVPGMYRISRQDSNISEPTGVGWMKISKPDSHYHEYGAWGKPEVDPEGPSVWSRPCMICGEIQQFVYTDLGEK